MSQLTERIQKIGGIRDKIRDMSQKVQMGLIGLKFMPLFEMIYEYLFKGGQSIWQIMSHLSSQHTASFTLMAILALDLNLSKKRDQHSKIRNLEEQRERAFLLSALRILWVAILMTN